MATDIPCIVLLLIAAVSSLVSLFAVNSGWAAGNAHPKSSWGPIGPSVTIHVELGW